MTPFYVSRSAGGSRQNIKGGKSNPFAKTEIKRGLDIGSHLDLRSTPKFRDTFERLQSKFDRSPSYLDHNVGGLASNIKGGRSNPFVKTGIKRGLDIGVHVDLQSTPRYRDNLEALEDVLAKALSGRLEETLNTSACPSCEEEMPAIEKQIVKPAYKCDEWDSKFRICVLERNIGDTVTFYLTTGSHGRHKPNVTWKKEFHILESNIRKEFIIDSENPPENIIIGKKGYELRISPITETDLGYNLFSATLHGYTSSLHAKVLFMIRIVPIDLGFVYVGETIEINLRSYVTLPAESLTFKWYMEKDGEHGTLPSNMRMSASGSSIKISELRQEQEGILACSVYTNLDFLATKKRFYMKDLVKNNDVLKSAPDHNLHFEEVPDRDKRVPPSLIRTKREQNIDDMVEKALMQPTTARKQMNYRKTTLRESTTRSYDDYDLERDVGIEESKAKTYENFPEGSDGRFQGLDAHDNRESQLTKQDYDSLDNNPVEPEEPQDNFQSLDSQLRNRNDGPSDKTIKEKKPHNYPSRKQQSSSAGKVPSDKSGQDNGFENVETMDLPHTSSQHSDDNRQYSGVQTKKGNYIPQNEESEIVLNIDKIPGPRRISAEENIAKLISSCYSDFECSGSAICFRSNLKRPGFCKCLPGFYGVGLFCREDIWISKSNFDVEELHDPEDTPYSSRDMSQGSV